MRLHTVVKSGEEFYLNRASVKHPCQLLHSAVFQLAQGARETNEAFEARTTRAARRQGIQHVVNLDGTN